METQTFINYASSIEKEISKKLATNNGWIIGEEADTQSNWTYAINRVLKEVSKSINSEYLVACKHKDIQDSPEWMYDFVCYHENEYGLNNVTFVAESEWMSWGKDYYCCVKYDFEKLLLARCNTRIMLFEEHNETAIVDTIDKLNSIVKYCQMTKKGDRYMYAAYNKSTRNFYIELHIAE